MKTKRYASIAIPMVGKQVVMVRDAKHQEMTFPGGGKKQTETPWECCVREVAEETHQTILLDKTQPQPHSFTYSYSTKDRLNRTVRTIVYVFLLHIEMQSFDMVECEFNKQPRTKGAKETDQIALVPVCDVWMHNLWDKIVPLVRRLDTLCGLC